MFVIIDTTTRRLVAAAVHEDGTVEARHGERDLDHSTTLISVLRSLIGEDSSGRQPNRGGTGQASSIGRLEGMGICLGPGSFTGTRIGLASVRALVQFEGVQAWGFTLFHAMALHGAELEKSDSECRGAIPAAAGFLHPNGAMVAIHARADQYYQARMTVADGVPAMTGEPFVGPLETLPAVASWDREQGAVEGTARYMPEDLPVKALADLLRKLRRDLSPSGDGVETGPKGWQGRLVPLYLQEPFAKIKTWNVL